MRPFFTTAVGSFPKPPKLLETRKKFLRGEISLIELRNAEFRAITFWIRFQNSKADISVHGEQDRDDMIAYFTKKLHGFEKGELRESFKRFCYHKPRCTGPICSKIMPGFTVATWKHAQSLSKTPVVGMLTDAFTIAAWSDNEYYLEIDKNGFFKERRREFVELLVMFITDEACELARAMVEKGIAEPQIQLDFPGVTTWPEDINLGIWAMNEVIDEVHELYPQVSFRTHICFLPPPDSYAKIYPKILELKVDTFLLDLEAEITQSEGLIMQNRTFVDLIKENPFTKTLVIGWQYVHDDALPDENALFAFIEKLLNAGMRPQYLGISPACGLKTRSVEVAQEFMLQNAEVAEKLKKMFL